LDNFEWPYLHNSSRSTYIARIARSSLLQHSFLVFVDKATTWRTDRRTARPIPSPRLAELTRGKQEAKLSQG